MKALSIQTLWPLVVLISLAAGDEQSPDQLSKQQLAAATPRPLTAHSAQSITAPLVAGDHVIQLTVDARSRSYRVHVPSQYEAAKPTPVVLAFHGATMTAKKMVSFSGLNEKSDEAGFIVVYPNGSGTQKQFLRFNACEEPDLKEEYRPDDVKFTAALLDDLATRVNVDDRRVFATGMSNGGMMCYRLAAELPERIAAIAPVAGTMPVVAKTPQRPIPVLHFHGTADTHVPYAGPGETLRELMNVLSVEETVRIWTEANGCPAAREVVDEPDRVDDGTTVRRMNYGPGKEDSEVVLYRIAGGGHTWPGNDTLFEKLLGLSTHDISANDLIWDFFQKHPRP